jgi:hypothetical protein
VIRSCGRREVFDRARTISQQVGDAQLGSHRQRTRPLVAAGDGEQIDELLRRQPGHHGDGSDQFPSLANACSGGSTPTPPEHARPSREQTASRPQCCSARARSAATSSFGACVRRGSRSASTGVRVRAVVGSIAECTKVQRSGHNGHRGRGQRVPTSGNTSRRPQSCLGQGPRVVREAAGERAIRGTVRCRATVRRV